MKFYFGKMSKSHSLQYKFFFKQTKHQKEKKNSSGNFSTPKVIVYRAHEDITLMRVMCRIEFGGRVPSKGAVQAPAYNFKDKGGQLIWNLCWVKTMEFKVTG